VPGAGGVLDPGSGTRFDCTAVAHDAPGCALLVRISERLERARLINSAPTRANRARFRRVDQRGAWAPTTKAAFRAWRVFD
jgi:hypothetical protein